jgi:hypothetical protein
VIDGFDDFLAWHGTRTGRFSVCSAYHTEWRHAFNGVTCRSLIAGTPLNNIIWKILWNLDVSAKVKIYCWCILQFFFENGHFITLSNRPGLCITRMHTAVPISVTNRLQEFQDQKTKTK